MAVIQATFDYISNVACFFEYPKITIRYPVIHLYSEYAVALNNGLNKYMIARGISAEEIVYIHHTNTEARKNELFARVRSGQVRVLIGSTQKWVPEPIVRTNS